MLALCIRFRALNRLNKILVILWLSPLIFILLCPFVLLLIDYSHTKKCSFPSKGSFVSANLYPLYGYRPES